MQTGVGRRVVVGPHSKGDKFFPQTSWSLLSRTAASGGLSPEVSAFADLYYSAVRGFIGSVVRDAGEAEELTQKFFLAAVLEGKLLQKADRSRGAFRDYLKQAIRNFLTDDYRRRNRKKRRADLPDVRPDAMDAGWDAVGAAAGSRHDDAFLRGWAQGVVHLALDRTRRTCEAKGLDRHYQLFVGRYMSANDDTPGWRELGEPYGIDEKTARSQAETVARHFRTALRALMISDGGSDVQPDTEIQQLLRLF